MNSIKVDRRSHAETVTIDAFVLLEADGAGVTDFERGFVSTEREAIKWKERSNGYNSYRRIQKTFTVHETLGGVLDEIEVNKVRTILSRISKEDRKLLAQYSQLLSEED